ncbi:filamentous hemagglutinin N-terminal domain-containing protein, partial [Acinetobacter schindleri]|uniref:two-partner secretion domain-containing protein n=1 Tax=Acinetobacter schindleri TaxID=108981 RepID=UPI0032142B27
MSQIQQSAELAKKTMRSRSKKLKGAALTGLVSACYSSLALALPTGEQVINNGGGTLSFDRNTANTLDITQSASRAIINWNNFDINQSELVKFIQTAGNKSVTLNRIGGNTATQISGALEANGNLFLINPAGIVFNNTAQVNVNGLLATTLDVNDAAFMNATDTVRFTGANNAASSIKNMGEIKAGGAVYLIAPEVDNQGKIIGTAVASRVGKVVLGAGDKFDVKFDSSNLIGFQINNIEQENSTTKVNSVKNSQTGTIQAESVFMTASQSAALESTVVNNSGVVEATSLIDLSAAKIQQSGKLLKDASSTADFKTAVINLTAAESISTNDSSKTAANILNLKTTNAEAGIGGVYGVNDGTNTTPISFDADLVNAQTNKGNIYLKDTAGGVKLGTIDTGANLPDATANFKTSVIANAVGGAIEASNNSTDVRRAYSFNLTAGGNSLAEEGNIGSSSNPLKLETSVLSAYAKNGGINISNASFSSSNTPLALILGNIKTEETINNILVQALDDGNGNIRFSDGSSGTKDISITNTGSLALTDTISATRNLTLSAGGGIQAVGRPINDATILPKLTAVKFSATAREDIGLLSQALQTNVETIDITTTDGGVFLSEQNGLKRADITATKDIGLSAESGDLVLGKLGTQTQKTVNSVTSPTNINVTSKKGSIIAAINNSPSLNLEAGELTLSAAGSIGTSNKNLKTSAERIELTNTSSNTATGSFLDNALALKSIKANVRGTNAIFKFLDNGLLSFDAITGKLKLVGGVGESLNFTNDSNNAATQNIVLDGLSLGAEQALTLSATGYVNQTGINPAIAKEINITAGTGIGTDQALRTQTSKATLKTTKGNIQISNNSSDLQLNAKALENNAQISIDQSGNLLVDAAQGSGKITLYANNGTLNNSANAIIKGNALDAKGTSIGSEENTFNTQIEGENVQLNATSGSIHYSNVGNITGTGLNATATGDMEIKNIGDVAFGTLSATGKMILGLTGSGTDANGDTVNFVVNSAEGLRYAAKSMGTESDKLELQVQKLLVDTTSGGIYAVNSNGTGFSLVRAVASGSGSNIHIESDKDLNLGVVESRGNTVSLKSGGKIEDARALGEKSPNIKAKSLELNATSGIGTQGDLALDVSYVTAAGGAGPVKASNSSAIALDESTLSNKSITISASDIIILDNGGRVISLQNGGTLSLTATGGNIVFLNQNDTLSLGGGGNITFVANYASSDKGYNGAIVAGNLSTSNGGNIKLEAASNITIGMLDAGAEGNVTVISHNGIILDGNGAAQNIRGNIVKLSAKTPDRNTAEINRETAISELAAKEALVSSLTTLKKNNEQSLNSDLRAEQLAETILKLAQAIQKSTQNNYDMQSAEADTIRTTYDNLMTAYNVAKIIADGVGLPAAIAQAVPFTGDGGAEATAKALELAAAVAELAADEFEKRYLGPKEAEVEELRNQLAEYNANVHAAQSDLSLAKIYRESSEANLAITTDDLIKATHAKDASLQIRRQAIAAYDLNKDIDSSATKPLGITANHLTINDGGTVNTSVYLDSTGNIGLGNIKLKAGEDLIVKTEGGVTQVGRVEVSSDLSNPSNINRGLISIESKGAIEGSPVNMAGIFIADDLAIKAQNGVGLNHAINTEVQNLSVDGGKGVNIYNSSENPLNITTLGTIVGVSGDGNISLKTEGDLVLKQLIKDTNLSSPHITRLTSVKGSIIDDNLSGLNIQSHALVAHAHNSINIDTQIDALVAHTDTTGQGDIEIREVDDLTLHDVNAGNGNVDILGGNLLVKNVKALGSSQDDNVGNIILKTRNNHYVRDDGDNSTFIEGKKLTIQAGADVGGNTFQPESNRSLDTKVDRLDIAAQGVVNITDIDDLDVESIQTTGDVTIQSLTGDLNIGRILTKTDADSPTTVTLFAKQGAIHNNLTLEPVQTNIVTNNLALKAKNGIGTVDNNFQLEVDRLEAETQIGGIYLTDHTGDLQVNDVISGLGLDELNGLNVSASGNIQLIVKNGSLQQANQVSTSTGNVSFLAQNNVNIGQELKSSSGSINIQAITGSITTES